MSRLALGLRFVATGLVLWAVAALVLRMFTDVDGWQAWLVIALMWGLAAYDTYRARQMPLRAVSACLCPHCGYDLRATPERCPECGKTPVDP